MSKDDNSQLGKEKGALAQSAIMGASGGAATMTNLAVHKTAKLLLLKLLCYSNLQLGV